MPDILTDTNGILKLLANLKTDKASGPDDTKPIVLKELRNAISPAVREIFETALETRQLSNDWTRARASPPF